MKRIVAGRAYNTEKSVLVADSQWKFEDDDAVFWDGTEALYQGRTGAFFLVVTYTATGYSSRRDASYHGKLPRDTVDIFPLSTEQAITWSHGKTMRIGGASLGWGDNIRIVTPGILPGELEEV